VSDILESEEARKVLEELQLGARDSTGWLALLDDPDDRESYLTLGEIKRSPSPFKMFTAGEETEGYRKVDTKDRNVEMRLKKYLGMNDILDNPTSVFHLSDEDERAGFAKIRNLGISLEAIIHSGVLVYSKETDDERRFHRVLKTERVMREEYDSPEVGETDYYCIVGVNDGYGPEAVNDALAEYISPTDLAFSDLNVLSSLYWGTKKLEGIAIGHLVDMTDKDRGRTGR
jgi:hypothetical protein